MYFRTTLKRTKIEFEQVSKDQLIRQPLLKQSLLDPVANIPEIFLNRFNESVLKRDSSYKLCSPLIYERIRYPKQAAQFKQNNQFDFHHINYAFKLFWIFAGNTLVLWEYNNFKNLSAFKFNSYNAQRHQFEQPIQTLAYGRFLVNQKCHIMVFAIAFPECIKLFHYDDRKIIDLDIKISTNGELVHQIVISSQGNIFYAGSRGTVKLLKNTSLLHNYASIKSCDPNSLLFGLMTIRNPIHQIDSFKIVNTVNKIVVNENRDRLYCLLNVKHSNSWISKRLKNLFGQYAQSEVKIVVYAYDKNIRYSHEINQSRLQSVFLQRYPEYRQASLAIQDIFLHRNQNTAELGILFKCGIMIILKNTRTLEISKMQLGPTANSEGVINSKMTTGWTTKAATAALGLNNLIYYSDMVAVSTQFGEDTACIQSSDHNIVEISADIRQTSTNCFFEQERVFLGFTQEGVEFIKKMNKFQTLLVYLQIHSQLMRSPKERLKGLSIYDNLIQVYGCIEFGAMLIEVICNQQIQTELRSQIYIKSKQHICSIIGLKCQDNFVENEITLITNTIALRQLAIMVLKDICQRKLNRGERMQLSHGQVSQDFLGSYEYSCLLYFHNIFDQVRQTNIFEFHKMDKDIRFCIQKFVKFKDFLNRNPSDFVPYSVDTLSVVTSLYNTNTLEQTNKKLQSLTTFVAKLTQTMDKIVILLQLCPTLILIDPVPNLTIFNILTTQISQQIVRSKILEAYDHKFLLTNQLIKKIPEVLSKQHIIYEGWRRSSNRCWQQLYSVIRVLDEKHFREISEDYKTRDSKQLIKLIIFKMQFLIKREQQINSLISQKNQAVYFESSEIRSLERELSKNKFIKQFCLQQYQRAIKDTIQKVRNNQTRANIDQFHSLIKFIKIKKQQPLTDALLTVLKSENLINQIQILNQI